MSFPSNRYLLRPAVPEDSRGILGILEETDFKGNISLMYTRRPDAYRSLMQEGKEVLVLVCQDTATSEIIGVGACAVRSLFVNGRTEKVGYLMGLRLKKEYRTGFQLLAGAYSFLYEHLRDRGIEHFITTILEENLYAQRLLEKRRKIMPFYETIGSYEVYTIKTRRHMECPKNLEFKRACKSDGARIVGFLQKQGRNLQFFPSFNERDIAAGSFPGLSWEDFYLLTDGKGEILATGAAWVQTEYKQYVVQGYGGALKHFYPLSFLLPIFGYPKLPEPGSVLNFYTLSFWAVRDNNPQFFRAFVHSMACVMPQHPFFLIGMHRRNPLREIITGMRHIRYASKVYLVNWEKKAGLTEALKAEFVPYLECGTL